MYYNLEIQMKSYWALKQKKNVKGGSFIELKCKTINIACNCDDEVKFA